MIRWRLWAVGLLGAAALASVSGLLAYQWGYTSAERELAEAREEAIRDAVAQDRRERARLDQQVRSQERERLERLRAELAELRAKDERLAEFRASERADEMCLGDEELELYRSY